MTSTPTICFDLDGTLNCFYDVPNWLEALCANDPAPYREARPALKMGQLARQLNTLKRKGARLVVVSWLSKNSNAAFDEKVKKEKLSWLNKHLASVAWDEIFIVPYGTNKAEVCGVEDGTFFLFDDEKQNIKSWSEHGGFAFYPESISTVLSGLNRQLG